MASINVIDIAYMEFLKKYVNVYKEIKRLDGECDLLLIEYNELVMKYSKKIRDNKFSKISKKPFYSNRQILTEMMMVIDNMNINYKILYDEMIFNDYKRAKEHVAYLKDLINVIPKLNDEMKESLKIKKGEKNEKKIKEEEIKRKQEEEERKQEEEKIKRKREKEIKKKVEETKKKDDESIIIDIPEIITNTFNVSHKIIGDKCNLDKSYNCMFIVCDDAVRPKMLSIHSYCRSNWGKTAQSGTNFDKGGYYYWTPLLHDSIMINEKEYQVIADIQYVPPINYNGKDHIDMHILDMEKKDKVKIRLNFKVNTTQQSIISPVKATVTSITTTQPLQHESLLKPTSIKKISQPQSSIVSFGSTVPTAKTPIVTIPQISSTNVVATTQQLTIAQLQDIINNLTVKGDENINSMNNNITPFIDTVNNDKNIISTDLNNNQLTGFNNIKTGARLTHMFNKLDKNVQDQLIKLIYDINDDKGKKQINKMQKYIQENYNK